MKPLITIVALLLCLQTAFAQQQIIQGQRLPRLTTAQRDQIETTNNVLANGQVVFNTDINCLEYWNGKRWISLCEGSSHLTIEPDPCPTVNAEGTDCDREYEVSDPDCGNGPFSFVIVAGSEFAYLTDVNQADGKFKISFHVNNSINPRSAVVRVTSSCTGLYKDFIFMQDGQVCTYAPGDAPEISVVSRPIELCAGGAVYLSVSENTPNLNDLIWTRNNVQVARGVNQLVVTQAGVYDVFMGFVGCGKTNGNAVTVTRGEVSAPKPVSIIVGQNNGLVCDIADETRLYATAATSGAIVWYQNGARTTLTGSPVMAGIGNWFAVVEDGSCSSIASNPITVMVDPTVGLPIATPTFTVNEKDAVGSLSICRGGSLRLAVDNHTDPTVSYSWYVNNTMIGSGKTLEYSMVGITNDFILQVRATGNGCSSAGISEIEITPIPAPQTPFLNTNPNTGALCDGTGTLIATPANAEHYIWYRNGEVLIKTDDNTHIINSLGDYSVKTMVDNCVSDFSNSRPINVASASNAQVEIYDFPKDIEIGTVRSFTAVMDNPQGATYTWSVTDGAVLLSSANTNPATVRFDSDPAGLILTAKNLCGDATVKNAGDFVSITVGTKCSALSSINYTPTLKTLTETAGSLSATLSLNPVGGTFPYAYTWYEGSSLIADPANDKKLSSISNSFTLPGTLAVGKHYFYAVVTNCKGANITVSDVFEVNVKPNPALIATGAGKLGGRSCFDIAFSNDNVLGCGSLSARDGLRANFTQAATNSQIYTFTPEGTVSKLRFEFVESQTGMIVESVTPHGNYDGNNISTACKVTLIYKSSLNETAKGLTAATRLTVDIYAIYNDKADGTGVEKAVKLTVQIKDCACCGSNGVAVPQGIGNNEYLTHMYMTGSVNRCWMVENSREGTPTWTTYPGQAAGARGYYYNWNAAQTACPAGWHVPSHNDFGALKTTILTFADNFNADNPRRFWSGMKGPHHAGSSENGWTRWDTDSYWWSSTSGNVFWNGSMWSYIPFVLSATNSNGYSVRCVQDN